MPRSGQPGVNRVAWHMNDGHPAVSGLERCSELVAQGLTFDVAAAVFTTHMRFERLMRLGVSSTAKDSFIMTAPALWLPRRHNGVSRMHRGSRRPRSVISGRRYRRMKTPSIASA